MLRIFFITACLVLLSSLAIASDRFSQMDTNKDNQVSWEEFKVSYPNMKEAAFEAIDTNKDKYISVEEWKVFRSSHAKSMQGQMPPSEVKPLPLITPPQKN